ncbi:MAG: glycosyltransferase family 4 protein [Candidatus Omnitrophota bacterium]
MKDPLTEEITIIQHKMKIIFITREGYRLAGARVRCYNFSRGLMKYGIESEVFSFADTLGARDGEGESAMGIAEKIKLNYLAFKRLIKEKNSIFCIQRFNYHSFAPYLGHLFLRNKIIFDLDDWEMRENPKYYFGFYPSSKAHFCAREIAKRSVFCISASRFLQHFLGRFNRKVHYLPSGVDTQLFNPAENIPAAEKIVISWIGTFNKMEYIENIDFALRCFVKLRKKHKDIHLDIVGDGIYKDSLVRLVTRFNDSNVRIKDWIAPDEMPIYLRGIQIGILPVRRSNSFNLSKSPTKLFEYMAMQKPTVCSAIGEAMDIVKDGDNGYLACDADMFIKKMGYLIDNSSLRKQMGARARESVEDKYSLGVLCGQFKEILESI